MPVTVKVGEAKTHLSELLARVEAGEEFVIARGDQPVARLVPLDERAKRRVAIEALRAERRPWMGAPITIDEIIAWKHEGYLATAITEQHALACLDKRLRSAAAADGIPVLPESPSP